MSEQLLKAIALAFKINADEFIATLKDGDDWLSDDEVGTKVSALISEKVTAAKTQSRKSGQGEQNAKVLKAVKAAGYENPDNLQGDELISAFIVWKDEQVESTTGDTPIDQMDKDTLAKLPIVKSLILEAKQESGKGNEKIKAEFEAYKLEVERERAKNREERAFDIAKLRNAESLRKGKVVLKVDGISEEDRIEAVMDRIRLREKIGLDAKGEPIFLGEDGEQRKDEYGNPISFADIVVSYGKAMFGIAAQDSSHEGANHPANQQHGQSGAYVPKYRFANISDYDNKYMETSDPAERLEINKSKAFHQEKAAGN
jgi:hypothetical protein